MNPDNITAIKENAFIILQWIIPHHLLSRLMHTIARSETQWVKNTIINRISKSFNITLHDAIEKNPKNYRSFNHFFTRELSSEARPMADNEQEIISPVDGCISQIGGIEDGNIIQAKGRNYTVEELLAGNKKLAEVFRNGAFTTLYLSPRDYHRIHMPIDGTLKDMWLVPGRLFSVNNTTARKVPKLFARNERLVCLFDTAAGPMALIMVGAIFVSSMETVWSGTVSPRAFTPHHWSYREKPQNIQLKKGEEMGRFNMGSTVILLFGQDATEWVNHLEADDAIQVKQPLAYIND